MVWRAARLFNQINDILGCFYPCSAGRSPPSGRLLSRPQSQSQSPQSQSPQSQSLWPSLRCLCSGVVTVSPQMCLFHAPETRLAGPADPSLQSQSRAPFLLRMRFVPCQYTRARARGGLGGGGGGKPDPYLPRSRCAYRCFCRGVALGFNRVFHSL